jgi:hypothetical protein
MIDWFKSLFDNTTKPDPPSPKKLEEIKEKVEDALEDTRQRQLDGEIWKDQEISEALSEIRDRLTDEEMKQVSDLTVGKSKLNGDLVAQFRGEKVTSFDPERFTTKEEFRNLIQEEVSKDF